MIGDCPKCGDRMVALFQTPKCERCELGGKERNVPTFYASGRKGRVLERGFGFTAVFKEEKHALMWAKHRGGAETFPETFPVVLGQQSYPVKWRTGEKDLHDPVLVGLQFDDIMIYPTEDRARDDEAKGVYMVLKP